jgi:hypothetical protein
MTSDTGKAGRGDLYSEQQRESVQRELQRLLESPHFSGAKRCRDFLAHIVKETLAGRAESLKERSLGACVFDRSPVYDTGGDSIVRVTATDLRKKLAQYYLAVGQDYAVRIDLPVGGYQAEFRWKEPRALLQPDSPVEEADAEERPAAPPEVGWASVGGLRFRPRRVVLQLLPWVLLAVAAAFAVSARLENRALRATGVTGTRTGAARLLPWSAVIGDQGQAYVVVADGNLGLARRHLGGGAFPLAAYAERRYFAAHPNLTPEARDMAERLLLRSGRLTSIFDVSVAIQLARVAPPPARLIPRFARDLNVKDFKTNDSFIILGSATANPWVSIAEDQMRFTVEKAPNGEGQWCRDKTNASTGVVPRRSDADGMVDTCAVFAFVANPLGKGHIVVLAGAGGDGTEAAGEFATRADLLGPALEAMGIGPSGRVRHFEMLLRLRSLDYSPVQREVVASRVLPD